jgi:hypothetical protein
VVARSAQWTATSNGSVARVVLDVARSGVNLGQEAADVLQVLVERQIPGRTRAESIAGVRPAQPCVIGASERVWAEGEHLAIDFEREWPGAGHTFGFGAHAGNGLRVAVAAAWVDRLHATIFALGYRICREECVSLQAFRLELHLIPRRLLHRAHPLGLSLVMSRRLTRMPPCVMTNAVTETPASARREMPKGPGICGGYPALHPWRGRPPTIDLTSPERRTSSPGRNTSSVRMRVTVTPNERPLPQDWSPELGKQVQEQAQVHAERELVPPSTLRA